MASIPVDRLLQPPAPARPAIRRLDKEQPSTWLGRGAADFAEHPVIGLSFGLAFAALGWFALQGLSMLGMGSLILPLAAGFPLLAPVLAVGLYDISRRNERGLPVTWRTTFAAMGRNPEMTDVGLVLTLVFMVWIQTALLLFALFYGTSPPPLTQFALHALTAPQGWLFLLVGTVIGAGFAALAFALSLTAVPMMLDRPVDAMTAMRTSIRAAWINRKVMIGWAATLAVLTVMGMACLLIGLAVTLPIAAHASWHAYRDMVEPQ